MVCSAVLGFVAADCLHHPSLTAGLACPALPSSSGHAPPCP